ncbi:cytochrome C oxidase subunit IV family protein [Ruegeria arenilitoris]|uniref:cytochrome C oxidase subunit IV family protein n=1 Tax=Ruegeria arenilitoris TaxID=1173585 RepID=UPI00147E0794|nr:cytochrome C oxidase subunit IV family protein [Ruegeria arenilitoris]
MRSVSSRVKCGRRRRHDPLTCAWLGLLALSLTSALLTLLHSPQLVAAGVLALALIKARVILAQYLDLARRPRWLRGFTMVLTIFSVLIFGLYLV